MKIAIFSDDFYPQLSGIADSVIALARELARRGHQVNFYVSWYPKRTFDFFKSPRKELDLGPNVKINRCLSLPYPREHSRITLPNPLCWLAIRKFNPDIIHVQSFLGIGLNALISSKISGIPIVGTNHTAVAEYVRYLPIKSDWIKRIALRYVIWFYSHCDYVTAPSESVFKEMKESDFKISHQAISNPVDTEMFNARAGFDKEKAKKDFGFSDKTVIYAGRIAIEKNLEIILKAFSLVKEKIPDAILALAGKGSEEGNLKRLSRNLNVYEEVKFLGSLSKPELSRAYRASEVFAITSESETQSLTLMQAMASGIPAVGVKARALPEYIKSQYGFVVEPKDDKGLAEKIAFLLQNREIREKMGKDASAFVENFSISNIAQKWLGIYQSLIDKNRKNL